MTEVVTTTTTATHGVNATYINPILQAALRPRVVAVPLCAQYNMAGKNSKVLDIVAPDADAVEDITEGTAIESKSFATARVQITIAQVGIHRQVSELALRTNIFDLEGYLTRDDGPAAIAMEMDTDVTATYANASVGVSDTGVNADFSDFLELIALHAVGLGGANTAFVGHPRQVGDIRSSALTSSAAAFGNSSSNMTTMNMGQAATQGYVGDLVGIPVYQTTVCPTANASADRVGALFSVGSAAGGDDRTAATGFAYLWLAEVMQNVNTFNTSRLYGITGCYGTAEIMDRSIVSLTTDA